MTKFKSLLKSKIPTNEFKYFNNLNTEQQKIVLKKMKELNEYDKVDVPYKIQLIESNIPVEYKSCAIKKINNLTYMDPGSGEYYKIKQWVDTFMRIPFNIHRTLPVKMDDGPEKCNKFMVDAKNSLDNAVYGLDDAKMQILQIVGQWISNPDSVGNAIAIQGPMGTGKTTLVKEGISKILNRPFAFLALGGATDSSFLEGHSYTYEGSSWGKIVDILLNSKCMNPVIYFDELDKISNTPKGQEIIGILTHLTDLTQNSQYHDKYFSNIDFDLSKALFIFSYNDEKKVNKILLDRMYRIKTKGYDNKQKITIANNYLIPSIIKNVNFKKEDIVFPKETLEYIISNYTEGEKGVRNFRRALEIIYTKLNLYRLMDEDTKLFEDQKTFKVSFPHTVSIENVRAFIKKNQDSHVPFGMYM
jgi:ATP-dependent Lon protease